MEGQLIHFALVIFAVKTEVIDIDSCGARYGVGRPPSGAGNEHRKRFKA